MRGAEKDESEKSKAEGKARTASCKKTKDLSSIAMGEEAPAMHEHSLCSGWEPLALARADTLSVRSQTQHLPPSGHNLHPLEEAEP
jgi:hypothetical protein